MSTQINNIQILIGLSHRLIVYCSFISYVVILSSYINEIYDDKG